MATIVPIIAGLVSARSTVSEAAVNPFAGATITDGNAGALETLTITLSGAGGTLVDGTGFAGLVLNADGTYKLSGTTAAVSAQLAALTFRPLAGAAGTSSTTTFALSDVASFAATPITLATFNTTNGAYLFAGLTINAAGTLIGVTQNGGPSGLGQVFALFKGTSGYGAPIPIASFTGANGSAPHGTLVADAAGNLFGTTNTGGANGLGTVFEIFKGTSYSAPVTLATFNGTNGSNSLDGLVIDAAGNLFGTTNNGGANGLGTVFELVKGASGYGALTTLASFSGANGSYPRGLIVDAAGNLFGETIQGGATGVMGTVFELVKGTSGYGAPVTIAAFTGANGANPRGGLLLDAAGNLFGMTSAGGAAANGTVFEIIKTTTGYNAPITLATIDGVNQASVRGGLIADAAGNLFGTTFNGGALNDGSVFELVKTGTTYSALVTLVTFNGTNGAYPYAGLTIDSAGNLFGTTSQGGPGNIGTVFEVSASQLAQASAVAKVTVTNTDPVPAPVVTNGTTVPTYTVGGAAVAVASTIAITDPGIANLQSASVTISSGFRAGDVLSFTAQTGITASYNATTGVLTLTGSAALATYKTELASIKFASTANDPTFANTDMARGLTLVVNNGTLASTPLAIALNLTKPAGKTYTLGTTAVTIAGAAGDDVISSAATTLLATDVIDGGLGTNTLKLTGGGSFNLATPKTLAHIQIVNVGESQTAVQTVTLRSGLNADVMVASGTAATGNTSPLAIAVIGVAGDSSVIHLGKGTDTVTLGSATESVVGTGGTAIVNATAATAGALISDVGGSVALTLTGGGTAALNKADVGIKSMTLAASTAAWNFTTDGESGLSIVDKSTTADLINLLGANASVTLGSGASTVAFHANPGRDVITGFIASGTGHDTLQVDKTVFADWAHLLGATTQSGADLLITIDANDSVLLKNVTLAAFASTDAKFV
ncbi:choice-of-anchor tandem repeat GloVer-containing protein [Novosphingobium sp.]|uniref:beta strand repeat-containing protein n=1 Tax=Novosphingobium sp. TaxID=1874826 RepID=UPI0033412577